MEKPMTRTTPPGHNARPARSLAMILAAIAGPCILAYLLIAADMRVNLSGLKPRYAVWVDGTSLVGWENLGSNQPLNSGIRLNGSTGVRVCMLGYMMKGHQTVPDGTPINMFVLMPEAGHLLRPARSNPNEMVQISLAGGKTISYKDRSMVWVEGLLRECRGSSAEQTAAYSITQASATKASDRDIAAWYVP
jgi:hypothetical protein